MRVMNSVFRIENDILLLNTYFNSQIYKNFTYHQNLALAANPKTGYIFECAKQVHQDSDFFI